MPRLTRWLAVARIARRDAKRHKGRTALIVAMLMLPAIAGGFYAVTTASGESTTATTLHIQLGTNAQALVRSWENCELVQTRMGGAMCADMVGKAGAEPPERTAPPATADQLKAALPPGDEVLEDRTATANLSRGQQVAGSEDTIHELDLAKLPGYLELREGREPRATGDVVLPAYAAQTLGARVGDTVSAKVAGPADVELTVVGLLTKSSSYGAYAHPGSLPATAFDSGDSEQAATPSAGWLIVGPEPVTWDHVTKLNKLGASVVSRDVVLNPPPGVPEELDDGYVEEISWTEFAIVGALIAIVLIEVILIIGPAFAVGARRSRHTLALISASGGEARDLRRVIVLNGLGLGALAGALGVGLGAGAAAAFVTISSSSDDPDLAFFPNLQIPWLILAAIPIAGGLLGLLAAWIPGRRVATLDPVAALRGGPDVRSHTRVRSWPGLVTGLAAALMLASGLVTHSPMIAMGGAVVLLLALIMCAGPIVVFAAKLAPRASIANRIALRDAERHLTRTAPALAAVIACVAGGTVIVGYQALSDQQGQSIYRPLAAPGVITLAVDRSQLPNTADADYERAMTEVSAKVKASEARLVTGAAVGAGKRFSITAACPGHKEFAYQLDCSGELERTGYSAWSSDGLWMDPDFKSTTVVDDGTVIEALGLPGADKAAQALREGKVLVTDPAILDAKGTVTMRVTVREADAPIGGNGAEDEPAPLSEVTKSVPAFAVPAHKYQLEYVLPPAVAKDFGLSTRTAGAVIVPESTPSLMAEASLRGELAGSKVDLTVERKPADRNAYLLYLYAFLAVLIAAAATWIAVGLAAADSKADMLTLGAVGAAPRTRRRVAGAQAAVIALVGAVVGTAGGLAIIAVLARIVMDDGPQPATWAFEVPWSAQVGLSIGVPLLAIAGAWLTTRSRLPLLARRAT